MCIRDRYPTKLEEQIKYMKKNKYSFSYTSYEEIDENDVTNGVKVTAVSYTHLDVYKRQW